METRSRLALRQARSYLEKKIGDHIIMHGDFFNSLVNSFLCEENQPELDQIHLDLESRSDGSIKLCLGIKFSSAQNQVLREPARIPDLDLFPVTPNQLAAYLAKQLLP